MQRGDGISNISYELLKNKTNHRASLRFHETCKGSGGAPTLMEQGGADSVQVWSRRHSNQEASEQVVAAGGAYAENYPDSVKLGTMVLAVVMAG